MSLANAAENAAACSCAGRACRYTLVVVRALKCQLALESIEGLVKRVRVQRRAGGAYRHRALGDSLRRRTVARLVCCEYRSADLNTDRLAPSSMTFLAMDTVPDRDLSQTSCRLG